MCIGESLELCSSGAEASTVLHGSSAAALYNLAVLVEPFSQKRLVTSHVRAELSKRRLMQSAKQ